MADPTVIQCAGQCTVTVVHQLHIPVLDLTIEQGQLIGGAIVLVWAIAYCFRQVGRQLSAGANHQESE
ncbi:hypothetical protein [Variovorax sp. GB1P17]|uniref:hypothetical protein n=1 Tax=Variovorax sp. GB1P17 TaxID=3443740 RepID=UPI003F474812